MSFCLPSKVYEFCDTSISLRLHDLLTKYTAAVPPIVCVYSYSFADGNSLVKNLEKQGIRVHVHNSGNKGLTPPRVVVIESRIFSWYCEANWVGLTSTELYTNAHNFWNGRIILAGPEIIQQEALASEKIVLATQRNTWRIKVNIFFIVDLALQFLFDEKKQDFFFLSLIFKSNP